VGRDFVDLLMAKRRCLNGTFFWFGVYDFVKDKCSYESMVPSVALYENGTVPYLQSTATVFPSAARSDLTS